MTGFVRLSPQGVGTLEDWGLMPDDELIAGVGAQTGHLWLDDAAIGLMVGVWECTPMTGRIGPWSTNEAMILVDGSVTIDHEDGTSVEVTAGEAFYIPKGTVCSWRQEGDLKKYFVIHTDSSGETAADPDALRARKIDFAIALRPTDGPDPALIEGPAPECSEALLYTDVTGQFSVGVWRATPYRRAVTPFPRHEVMHILEGAVTLYDGAGREETFVAGDTCFVPQGAPVGWNSTVPVRKVFFSFSPRD